MHLHSTKTNKKKGGGKRKSNYKYIYETFAMEANELFIFKRSLLSLRTHGCNNLFIPPTGERPLLEKERGEERGRGERERERQQTGWGVERK